MSQISPPIRILLAGSLVFMVAWFIFLKPGGATTAAAPSAAPAAAGAPTDAYGSAVAKAKSASAATTAASNIHAGVTPGSSAVAPAASASTPATATAPAGAPAAASTTKAQASAELGLPPSVAAAVASKKVLVMLFWNKNAIDDKAVRRELRHIDRHHGKVVVHVASIKDIARYAPITRGVDVEQSPTVVVAKGATADSLVGYVDSKTIDQAVSDLMRAR
jgi:hypothetical protein